MNLRMTLALLFCLLVVAGCSAQAEQGGETDKDLPSPEMSGLPWVVPAKEIKGLSQHPVGEGDQAAVIITADQAEPGGQIAVYLHPWAPLPPSADRVPIRLLVAAGFTVVYPVYQGPETGAGQYLGNAIAGIKSAFDELAVDPERVVAIGSTTGGALAFDLAAVAAERGLPTVASAVAVSPGRNPDGWMPRPSYASIPSSARLTTVDVPGSRIPGSRHEARRMLKLASQVPDAHKRRLVWRIREGDRSQGWAPVVSLVRKKN